MNVNKFFSSIICIQSSVFLEKFDRQPQGWIVGNSNEICTRFRKICVFDNNVDCGNDGMAKREASSPGQRLFLLTRM